MFITNRVVIMETYHVSFSVAMVMQVQLQMHMEQFFENAKSVQRAIDFTQRFERSVLIMLL